MSKKGELKKRIKESETEIENLEKRRGRSQSALLQAVGEGVKPPPTDVGYFKTFTKLIELERENLHKLKIELEKL